MTTKTAVGLLPEPGRDSNVGDKEPDPWETDYVAGYESAYMNMVRVVGLGIEHWVECPGCPGCDILGMLVNQVRLEASEANYRVVRETMYGEGDYGGPGFGYIETGDSDEATSPVWRSVVTPAAPQIKSSTE